MSSAEALQYYLAALKQGQREYKNCVHRGLAPNIQALGPDKLQLSQVNLGVMDVPIYLVVGSTEEARSRNLPRNGSTCAPPSSARAYTTPSSATSTWAGSTSRRETSG